MLNKSATETQIVLPFLKWAGGKRWLMERHASILDVPHQRFLEPFLGSGAVFFKLAPENSILSDRNSQLINTYRAIRQDWASVEALLREHHKSHCESHYYETRAKLPDDLIELAARFIYLNRTCWNGLYRVNTKGQFNVPIGTKSNVILDSDNFESVAFRLKNAELRVSDFEETIDLAGDGDLLFVDPPYTVKHNHNGFVKYNESLFTWDDQVRLKNSLLRAISRGAKAIVTNACHDSVKQLYDGIGEHLILERASVIAGSSAKRGRYEEMVILCL